MDGASVKNRALESSIRTSLKRRKPSVPAKAGKAFSRTIKNARQALLDKKRLSLGKKKTTYWKLTARRRQAGQKACVLLKKHVSSREFWNNSVTNRYFRSQARVESFLHGIKDYMLVGKVKNPALRMELAKCFFRGARSEDLPGKFRCLALDSLKRCVLSFPLKTSQGTLQEPTSAEPVMHLLTYMLHNGQRVIGRRQLTKFESADVPAGVCTVNDEIIGLFLRRWPHECETGANPSTIEQALLNSETLKRKLLSQAIAITGHIDKTYVASPIITDITYMVPLLHDLVTSGSGIAVSLSTIQLVIKMGANVNITDVYDETALSKSLEVHRRACHSEALRILFQAEANMGRFTYSRGQQLSALLFSNLVSIGVKSLAVCSWLRNYSLQSLRMFNREGRESTENSIPNRAAREHHLQVTQTLLWYGVPATDIDIKKVKYKSVKKSVRKGLSTPLSLENQSARKVLLSMKDLTTNSFSCLDTPPHINRRLATTAGIPEDEIRAAIPTIGEGTGFSSYIGFV